MALCAFAPQTIRQKGLAGIHNLANLAS